MVLLDEIDLFIFNNIGSQSIFNVNSIVCHFTHNIKIYKQYFLKYFLYTVI